MRNSIKILTSVVLGSLTAYLVSLTLGTAYREGALLEALIPLLIVPSVMFVLYEGSEKRVTSSLFGLLLTAAMLEGATALGMSWGGVSLVLSSVAAVGLPLAIDLTSIDLGKRIRLDRALANVTAVAFAVALVPLSASALLSAHRAALEEDTALVGELASKITPWENWLIVDGLDPKLRERAQRRVSIRSNGKTYELSDAAVESVVEERTVRKQTRQRGVNKSESVSKNQEERMRLILKLQGTSIPDDVVVYSRRGPLTISEAKVHIDPPSPATPDAPGGG